MVYQADKFERLKLEAEIRLLREFIFWRKFFTEG